MKRGLYFLLLAELHLVISCSQGNSPVLIKYPTAAQATDKAELFAPGLISTEYLEHSAPTFSRDGNTVLWSVIKLPSWKAGIFEMSFNGNQWSRPYQPSFCDTTASDISPSFSPDGSHLYFSSDRRLPSEQIARRDNRLWKVEKTGTGWGIPTPVDSLVSGNGAYAPSVAENGNLYFTVPFGSTDWNISIAQGKDQQFAAPVTLPPPINSDGYEDGPFIAPDESYLIFESDRPGGIDGSIDLYISFRNGQGIWGPAMNLGPAINSSAADRFARVSPDGRYLFFGSNRRKTGGEPNFDIYWINMSVVMALKDNPGNPGNPGN